MLLGRKASSLYRPVVTHALVQSARQPSVDKDMLREHDYPDTDSHSDGGKHGNGDRYHGDDRYGDDDGSDGSGSSDEDDDPQSRGHDHGDDMDDRYNGQSSHALANPIVSEPHALLSNVRDSPSIFPLPGVGGLCSNFSDMRCLSFGPHPPTFLNALLCIGSLQRIPPLAHARKPPAGLFG